MWLIFLHQVSGNGSRFPDGVAIWFDQSGNSAEWIDLLDVRLERGKNNTVAGTYFLEVLAQMLASVLVDQFEFKLDSYDPQYGQHKAAIGTLQHKVQGSLSGRHSSPKSDHTLGNSRAEHFYAKGDTQACQL